MNSLIYLQCALCSILDVVLLVLNLVGLRFQHFNAVLPLLSLLICVGFVSNKKCSLSFFDEFYPFGLYFQIQSVLFLVYFLSC